MSTRPWFLVIALCLWSVSAVPATEPGSDPREDAPSPTEEDRAGEASKAAPPEQDAATALEHAPDVAEAVSDELPIYIPPSRGAALSRVGAATRGLRPDLGTLQALAPDHVGLTTQAQPRLYWYLGETSHTRVDITLIDDVSARPLVEVVMEPPVPAGLHVLDCSAHGVSLDPGTTYQWFVAYVPEPQRRSHDVISSGAIERVNRSEVAGADAVTLARESLWYDAVMAVQDRSDGPHVMKALRNLSTQVGLSLTPLE